MIDQAVTSIKNNGTTILKIYSMPYMYYIYLLTKIQNNSEPKDTENVLYRGCLLRTDQ